METITNKFNVGDNVIVTSPNYNFLNGRNGVITDVQTFRGMLHYDVLIEAFGKRQYFENQLTKV